MRHHNAYLCASQHLDCIFLLAFSHNLRTNYVCISTTPNRKYSHVTSICKVGYSLSLKWSICFNMPDIFYLWSYIYDPNVCIVTSLACTYGLILPSVHAQFHRFELLEYFHHKIMLKSLMNLWCGDMGMCMRGGVCKSRQTRTRTWNFTKDRGHIPHRGRSSVRGGCRMMEMM